MKIEVNGEFFYVPDDFNVSNSQSSIKDDKNLKNRESGDIGDNPSLYSLLLGDEKDRGYRGQPLEEQNILAVGKDKENQNCAKNGTLHSPAKKNKGDPIPSIPSVPNAKFGFGDLPPQYKGNKEATERWLNEQYRANGFFTVQDLYPQKNSVSDEFNPI